MPWSPCLPRKRSRRESWPCLKVLSRNCCCLRIMSPSSFSACSMSLSPDWPGCAICRFSSICCSCSSNCLAASLSPERDSRSMRSIMLLRSCWRITLVLGSSGRASCCGLLRSCSASWRMKLSSAARRFSVSFLISSSLAPRSSACLSASCAARKRLVDVGDVAVLDGDGERPQAGDDLAHRVVGAGGLELPRDAVEAEILAGLGREQFRRDHQRVERRIDLRILIGVERQDAALLDQRPRQRLGEQPLRQPHVERLAAALIAGLVLCRQRQRDVGAGIRILAEILDGLADAIAGPRIRQHQRKLRRLEQRPRLGRRPSAASPRTGREMRLRFGDAVIVLDLVGHLQRAAGLTLRILGQRNGRAHGREWR